MSAPLPKPDAPSPQSPGRTASLSHRTAQGFVWMVLQTGGAQVFSFVAYIALGWLLHEEQFGLYATTAAIGVGAATAHKWGLRQLIVHRNKRFDVWANPAFWFALALGFVSSLIMVAIAPFADWIFGTDGLTGLILVLAITMPFTSISEVPEARIQANMRFRLLALVRFWMVTGTIGLTVLFAWIGWDVYSFVIARVIVAVSRASIVYGVIRPKIRLRPQIRRWRYMISDGARLVVSHVSRYITTQCDYFILGLFHPSETVGVYYYAFGLSQRAFVMLTLNLQDVLFPSLSALRDNPRRQVMAYLRATRLLVVLGMPICLLQIALAQPAFAAVLPPRWAAAAPVLQILSLGTIFRLAGQPAIALIQAQGRYHLLAQASVITSVVFLGAVTTGAIIGGEQAVAAAVAIYMALNGPVMIYIAVRRDGGRWYQVAQIFAVPAVTSVAATGAAWWLARQLPTVINQNWTLLFAIPALTGLFYLPLVRVFQPNEWAELQQRLGGLLRRKRRGGVS